MHYKAFGVVGGELEIHAKAKLKQPSKTGLIESEFLFNKADLFRVENFKKFVETEGLPPTSSLFKKDNFWFGLSLTQKNNPHPTPKLLLLMPYDKVNSVLTKEKLTLDNVLVLFNHDFAAYRTTNEEREIFFWDVLTVEACNKDAQICFKGTPLKLRVCGWEKTSQALKQILEKNK